ncbi:TPA: hypothetical protein HA281_01520 [Candidatus Woesearchaeota archaeon]|nr:hypothetical protein [Candidatus Woesearchaeota archaeon]HII64635.1 hypothetical protein [Candidatus Woesearchaeota archaeon]HII65966.1 hypothetical protein [Candidatus Woesearchaeota archaeon]
MTKLSRGGRFEEMTERFLKKEIPFGFYLKRGSTRNKILKKIPKEPDYLILNSKGKCKISVECKSTSNPKKSVRYWTLFSRGYTLLAILKLHYPKIKPILLFNTENKDEMDYYKICKDAKIEFLCLNRDKRKILQVIKGNCR